MNSKYTYMTLLGSDDYLKGTLALNHSLKIQHSKYPLTVLVTSNVGKSTLQRLEKEGIGYIIGNKIKVSKSIQQDNLVSGFANWSNTFSKLLIFGMTEFKKIVFLDSDMMVVQNIDHLFEKPHLSAVAAGQFYPGNEKWKDLNSGIMVVVPRKDEEKRLIKHLNTMNLTNGFGDQDVLQSYYSSWKKQSELHLEEEYNVFFKYEPYFIYKFPNKKIKVIHFVGKVKPWKMSKEEEVKYKGRLIINQLKKAKSLKGVKKAMHDFRLYKNYAKNNEMRLK